MQERSRLPIPGGVMLLVGLALLIGSIAACVIAAKAANAHRGQVDSEIARLMILAALSFIAGVFVLKGLFVMNPNEARVLQFFGRYVGTVRSEGLRWTNPLNSKHTVSLRVHNFETAKIKVNDVEGNPIEIAAVVSWRVVDTAKAVFAIESYISYVHVQAEAAVRNLATHYPYDSQHEGEVSLRGQTDVVAERLRREISARITEAGVEVLDARIAHLAYAPEIAQAMLQRQQAGAIIAARQRIVEGAVGMVELALQQLSARGVVEFDAQRKAQLVSNLLVVLCSERSTQPTVNAGS